MTGAPNDGATLGWKLLLAARRIILSLPLCSLFHPSLSSPNGTHVDDGKDRQQGSSSSGSTAPAAPLAAAMMTTKTHSFRFCSPATVDQDGPRIDPVLGSRARSTLLFYSSLHAQLKERKRICRLVQEKRRSELQRASERAPRRGEREGSSSLC